MKAYSIFDDFTPEAARLFADAGIPLTVHPAGVPRPDREEMKRILEDCDCVVIGTSQKLTEDMFEGIDSPRVIATASVGVDHIRVPAAKRPLVTVVNTPEANALSVAEYTVGCALSCAKRLAEGCALYREGRNNKALFRKPADLAGRTMGVVGAGRVSVRVMEYARMLGMRVLCWTRNPAAHGAIADAGVSFVPLDALAAEADVISVNLPNKPDTRGIISTELVARMKDSAVFISVSRLETVDAGALFDKARRNPGFYVCLDIDVDENIVRALPEEPNVLVTPHIAGGTAEARARMFREAAEGAVRVLARADGEKETE